MGKEKKLKQVNMFVQFGCGLSAPKSWVNFDSSPSLVIGKIPLLKNLLKSYLPPFPKNVRYGNIVKGLPVKDEKAKLVYASHVLEHLSLNDFRIALKNAYKILENNGVFRLIVPDLQWYITEYQQSKSGNRSYDFMINTHLGLKHRQKGLMGLLRSWFGNNLHLWMWDFDSINIELQKAGFKNIRRAYFNDSIIPQFKEVEDESRFNNSLAIECTK